ncbi:MAG: nucleotide exchange factor GrpE [Phycisphaerales bacterium]
MANEESGKPPTGGPEDCCGGACGEGSEPLPADSNLSEQIVDLRAQVEEANSRALRTMADFQNYQRRALKNENEARHHGASAVVMGVVNVMDHFDMALNADLSKATIQQVVSGVKVIREEMLKTLNQHGVFPLNPQPNDEFIPGRHEAVMQQSAEGVEPGRVVATFRIGYAMGDRVLRPAQVAVSPS